MAVAFNAAGAGGASPIGTQPQSATWTHNASGTNRAVVVWAAFYMYGQGGIGLTATYGGQAMELLGVVTVNDMSQDSGSSYLGITGIAAFGLLNAPTGSQTVVVTGQRTTPSSSSNIDLMCNSFSYTGVLSFGATAKHFGQNNGAIG